MVIKIRNKEKKVSKFRLNFTLKQHTPIIHFQSDQSGATLRATELKPKLDRFLLEQVEGIPFKENANGSKSLDYKVKIEYSGQNKIDYPKPFVKKGTEGYVAPYFADGVSIEHNDNEIKLNIFSFNEKILDAIKDNIKIFFSYENFATRQSKGFGAYHIKDVTKKEVEEHLKNNNKLFKLNKGSRNPKESLKIIDTFYKEIKSGLNYPKYKKSLLFQYMCTKDSGWEKRWIKQKFPSVVYGKNKPVNCQPPKEFFYIRALLGVAELNEYYPNGQENKLQIKIEGIKREQNDLKKADIQRFKSPITFKIFEDNIYLIYNDSYEKILGEEFGFTFKDKQEKISVPSEFDLYEFLKFVEKENLISEVK